MPSASIIVTQNSVSGAAGESRDDLVTGLSVTLSNADNTGVYSHRWLLLDSPTGSAISLSNVTSAICNFTPDVAGAYRIQLSVNQGNLAGQTQVRLAVVRNADGTRFFAYGEKGEEANWDDNERGRIPDLELWMDRIHTATVYEVDFTEANTENFVTGGAGTYDILDRAWLAANPTDALVFGLTNGVGLQWAARGSFAGTFTSAAQTAPYLSIPLATLIPTFDPSYNYVIDIHLSAYTFENNLDGVRVGFYGEAGTPAGSAARLRMGGIERSTGSNRPITVAQATNATVGYATTNNVISVLIASSGATSVSSGVWASGWPSSGRNTDLGPTAVLGATDPILRGDTALVLAFNSASDASPTSVVTIQHLRVRRV